MKLDLLMECPLHIYWGFDIAASFSTTSCVNYGGWSFAWIDARYLKKHLIIWQFVMSWCMPACLVVIWFCSTEPERVLNSSQNLIIWMPPFLFQINCNLCINLHHTYKKRDWESKEKESMGIIKDYFNDLLVSIKRS